MSTVVDAPTAEVARLLRRYRTRAGLTQEALAAATGLSVRAIGALEGGRRRHPRTTTIELLAQALGLSEADLRLFERAARRATTGQEGPRQLPPPIADFTGRSRELDELVQLLRTPYRASPGVIISAINGMGGVGKTTLAIQAGHQVAEHYPDGQLYLNLRGGGGAPLRPAEAIAQLLQALGVPVSGDPENLDLAASRLRTALAGRRVLILLDDATSVSQVTPLIPGTAGSTVVITSRRRLAALPGVRRLGLELLSVDEAVRLLGEIVGVRQVAAAPEAARAVVEECGQLPLAIRIAGGQAAGDLPALASRLADDNNRLNLLSDPGRGVRSSVLLSIKGLAESDHAGDLLAADAFPRLSLFGGDHFSLRVAAAVLGQSLDDTEDLLERLVDVHLLETRAFHEYRMHDLVRDVGRELATAALSGQERIEAHRRELRCYVATVWRYHQLRPRKAPFGDLAWAAGAEDLATEDAALEWLDAEMPNLLRLIRAASPGDAEERLLAARSALGLPQVGAARFRFAEAHEAMLAAVDLVNDRDGVLACGLLVGLAQLSEALGQYDRAVRCLQRALPIARRHGDRPQLTVCLIELGYSLGHVGRAAEGMPAAQEALELITRGDADAPAIGANVSLGVLAGMTGDLEVQRTAFERAQMLMDSGGTAASAPVFHCMIGTSLRKSGQFDAALPVLEKSLDGARQLGADVIEIDALLALGDLWRDQSDHLQALDRLTAALTIALRNPAENREGGVRRSLGQTYADLGQPDEARAHWERAITCFNHTADPTAAEVRTLLAQLPPRHRS